MHIRAHNMGRVMQVDLNVKVCDVCRQVGRGTESYAIKQGDREVESDLCNVHARPLEALLTGQEAEVAPKATPARAKRSAGRTAAPKQGRVKTLAEVQALKRS